MALAAEYGSWVGEHGELFKICACFRGRQRCCGGSPNFVRRDLMAFSSSDRHSNSELLSIVLNTELRYSRQRYVSTLSGGGAFSLRPALSSRSEPRSHPRGVKCHSVHSLLAAMAEVYCYWASKAIFSTDCKPAKCED